MEKPASGFDSSLDSQTPCHPTNIPDNLLTKIFACLRKLNLRYGVFDLRKDVDGDFYFFEVNPGGYFLHLDQRAGTNIAKNVARVLSR